MDQPTQELHIGSRAFLHGSVLALHPATCEPLVAADHHCPLHANAEGSRQPGINQKRKPADR